MKISSRGEYALRALIVLGQHRGSVMKIEEISKKTLVTVNYLEKILLQLKKQKLVTSKRGISGGYLLLKEPSEIIIGEVVRNIEGPLSPMGCASITKYEPCELEEGCLLKPLWSLVRDTIAFVLEQTTLEDLLENRVRLLKGEDFVVFKK
ncbi:RrF2 family transcriptional regulator [Bacillus marasmi]|uniref:RrF2 family transcriptional regulator n=1 Tax=Bacillus marasmi TaxID=1926279 RepID=UPI0011CA9216|nr:Rrf2 family transcriptional regulator [Bacillus marasmi]